jgi:two-component sensor histidine kinase
MRSGPISSFGFALSTFLAAFGLRFSLDPVLPPGYPFLTFFPAVLLSAFFGGLYPSILCAGLSFFAAWYFFIPPFGSLTVDFNAAVALGFFLAIVAADIVVIHLMNRTMERLGEEQLTTSRLLENQETMFSELQHRIANNLAFVSGILSYHARNLPNDSPAQAALADTRMRLSVMAGVHRKLYDPQNLAIPFNEFVRDVAEELIASVAASGRIRCSVRIDDTIALSQDQSMTAMLIIVELVTNALKHAFDAGQNGEIAISLQRHGDTLALVVRDDGRGFQPAAQQDGARDGGLGQRILSGFARNLGATIAYRADKGTEATVTFPAPRA